MSEVFKFQHPEVSALMADTRRAAVAVLLALPDEIPDTLEAELYVYRDVLDGIPDPYPQKPPQENPPQ